MLNEVCDCGVYNVVVTETIIFSATMTNTCHSLQCL